ncbi:hypothetical protein IAU60_002096 [Kwoniella sp. DSM 27419]
MTSLDPSHIPFRSSAQAVHRPSGEDKVSSGFPDTLPSVPKKGDKQGKARRQGRERVKQNVPPLPDLRFEQSYLLSIRPFLTPRPSRASVQERGPVEHTEKESKTLVTSADEDSVFHWGRQVDVDWRRVSWVTLRDQVISPLIQGALWGWATVFLASTGAVLRASLYPASHVNKGRITGGPGGSVKAAGGGSAVGETGWWRNWVGSWFGGVETAMA